MELQTITEDPHVARRKFLEYRDAKRAQHNIEDEAMMRGYRALSKGQSLIRLSDVILAGGLTTVEVPGTRWENERRVATRTPIAVPALAVARADSTHVWTHGLHIQGSVELRTKRELSDRNTRDRRTVRGFSENHEHANREGHWGAPRIRAIVPSIPPPLRPATKLSGYHVLFEAEWGIDPQPPVDPALLKHVGGDLYAVVAVWDLSPLEQAVLAGTRRG